MSEIAPSGQPEKPGRIAALDYLRGYFIAVIIIDHLDKFPSLWSFFTGERRLWMTAAEGFVIISGFLIGYVRGYKGLKHPFAVIAKKLLSRAALLYVAVVIASIIYFSIDWYLPGIPNVPSPDVAEYDWPSMLRELLLLHHASAWVYFLMLYAIFIFLAIGFIYLLRIKKPLIGIVLVVATYIWGFVHDIEWMKWQAVFFLPALAGFYFPQLHAWWHAIGTKRRHIFSYTLASVSLLLLMASVICSFFGSLLPPHWADSLNSAFLLNSFGPARVFLSLLWFTALAFLFHRIYPFLHRWTFGVLAYFGSHSLTAYLTHGLILCVVAYFIPTPLDPISNTFIGLATVLAVYEFIRIPFVKKIIPR